MDTVSLTSNKSRTQKSTETDDSPINFSMDDYYAIRQIHAEPQLFRFLVHSLCPSIYGHEIVKAGLILALFNGTQIDTSRRSVSHLLMVGDPGLGKSQMLRACSNVAPRSVYVGGNTSTVSGLTVTMTRDSGQDFSMEAGALVLADRGVCCIDEFDKMSAQYSCLLEAMEQQSVSVAKAGVSCSLTARTTVIAVANPAGGHYDKSKTVSENLKMGSALLSRFDLVFILLDQPSEKMDEFLSEHVLALRSGTSKKSKYFGKDKGAPRSTAKVTLKESLKLDQGENIDSLPHPLLRKYIAYAQKYVHPQLTQEAKDVLRQFYLELRRNYHTKDCTPVTARQLESLVRLTQARAKVELREEATGADAIDVVEIMRYSLAAVFADDLGSLDFHRSQNGSGVSNYSAIKKMIAFLQRKAETAPKSVFNLEELKEMGDGVGVPRSKFFDVLETLNYRGFLIKKGNNNYQLTSV